MSRLDARLVDVLEPVRDIAVGDLLESLARRLDAGADVRAEPKLRDATGKIRRDGELQLPQRGDLLVERDGKHLLEHIDCEQILPFAPVTLVQPGGFVAVLSPFRWDAAELLVEASGGPPGAAPDWAPLRRWFLEWFQSRFAEVAPDLDGAIHGLIGPTRIAGGWRVVIDFGSAPVECMGDLLAALAETGANRVRIGQNAQAGNLSLG